MALSRVEITSEVHLTCLTHAMSTENEEIMGLLLGDIHTDSSDGRKVSRIWMAMPQVRTDRRRDRVECSSEQLARAAAMAERFSKASGVVTRIIGWYHSHPHITVLPSHVDLSTQAMYQTLDSSFVGLIFSVFNTDLATKAQQVQVTAFQSSGDPGRETRLEVPLAVVPSRGHVEAHLSDYVALQRILQKEEKQLFESVVDDTAAADQVSLLHSSSSYHLAMSTLMQHGVGPALLTMEALRTQTETQLEELRKEGARLSMALAGGSAAE